MKVISLFLGMSIFFVPYGSATTEIFFDAEALNENVGRYLDEAIVHDVNSYRSWTDSKPPHAVEVTQLRNRFEGFFETTEVFAPSRPRLKLQSAAPVLQGKRLIQQWTVEKLAQAVSLARENPEACVMAHRAAALLQGTLQAQRQMPGAEPAQSKIHESFGYESKDIFLYLSFLALGSEYGEVPCFANRLTELRILGQARDLMGYGERYVPFWIEPPKDRQGARMGFFSHSLSGTLKTFPWENSKSSLNEVVREKQDSDDLWILIPIQKENPVRDGRFNVIWGGKVDPSDQKSAMDLEKKWSKRWDL